MNRFDVHSNDGTSLAVWVDGNGPPLVLVHGSVSDHTTLAPLIDEVSGHMTAFALDRRGFGASGDAPAYAIERDFEDVASVVDAVAGRSGGSVALFGHSYGASCAMGASTLTSNVSHLVLYEPSLGFRYPPGSIDAIQQAIDDGDLDRAVITMFVDTLGMTPDEVDAMRASTTPKWATRIASAHTLAREARVEDAWAYVADQFDAITAPTLLLTGSESPTEVTTATDAAAHAIPGARIHVLEGHGHMAHKSDPAMVSAIIGRFISASARETARTLR